MVLGRQWLLLLKLPRGAEDKPKAVAPCRQILPALLLFPSSTGGQYVGPSIQGLSGAYTSRHRHRRRSGWHHAGIRLGIPPSLAIHPMNAFVVSGLVKRRAELAGEIEKAHEALRKMVLDHIVDVLEAWEDLKSRCVLCLLGVYSGAAIRFLGEIAT
jgi:hypothetical protein